MEEGVYLNASQRAIIAARTTDPPGPVFQAEAARRLRVAAPRFSGQQTWLNQRAISYEQCERLGEVARACVARIQDLATPRETKSLRVPVLRNSL
jgi:hypothetical protein